MLVRSARPHETAAISDYEIRHHYNVPTEFYRLWLDPTMTYSCALWREGDDLRAAQEAKLDHLAEAARAAGARRVLDVGCGWGSLMRRLVDAHGVEHAVGLTVSDSQAEWIGGLQDDRLEVRVESWEDHEPDEPYDAIISIGAIEHFARKRFSREVRVEVYRRYFERCADMLVDGASMSLQSVAKAGGRLDRQAVDDFRAIDAVFPESAIPWPSELIEAAEGLFQLTGLRIDGEHYARTCRAWERSLAEQRDTAVDVAGEETVELYEAYLAASARRFENGHATLLRFAFDKVA